MRVDIAKGKTKTLIKSRRDNGADASGTIKEVSCRNVDECRGL
jgi:hypothetical protein